MWHFLTELFGITNGHWYNLWSGPLPDVTLAGSLIIIYRKHVCHQDRCWRIAKHSVGDGSIVVCKKHHPVIQGRKITAQHVQMAHVRHQKLLKSV